MTIYDFQHLLFVFSFFIMVIDGNMHPKEMEFNRAMYYKIETDSVIPYEILINSVISDVKDNPGQVIKQYFQTLEQVDFTDEIKAEFLETAYDMIHADHMIHPSEWEFLLLSKNKIGISDSNFKNEFREYSAEDRTFSNNPEFLDELLNSLDFSNL